MVIPTLQMSIQIKTQQKKPICVVCRGPYARLYNCQKLPQYIPGAKYEKLPKGVCGVCLYCATKIKPPACHKGDEKYICQSSKQNMLLCDKCPVVHKDMQNYFKSHHNSNMTIKQNFEMFIQTNKIGSNKTTYIAKNKLTRMRLNNCPIGQVSCPS